MGRAGGYGRERQGGACISAREDPKQSKGFQERDESVTMAITEKRDGMCPRKNVGDQREIVHANSKREREKERES